MDSADFQATWAALNEERKSLVARRDDIELELNELRVKIKHLDAALEHLSPLADQGDFLPDISQLGLTDAVLEIVKLCAPEKLSAMEVRGKLKELGYDLSGLSAPMASIYKVLGRLTEREENLKREKGDDGRVFYTWTGPQF